MAAALSSKKDANFISKIVKKGKHNSEDLGVNKRENPAFYAVRKFIITT